MEKLDFKPVSPDTAEAVYQYTSAFGEGSCQHSPVSMFSYFEKYGDSFCIEDGFLYVLRSHLCDEDNRVYMAPFGSGDLKQAYERILSDAHAYDKKAKFYTLTKKHADFLEKEFPGVFEIIYDRDLAEYIYSVNTMLEFPGKVHARRRTEIRSFWRDYGERVTVELLDPAKVDEVLAFAEYWMRENSETHDEEALQREMTCIRRQIDNFDRLSITGTVIRMDGKIKAFCYGTPLNEEYYDVLIEKGDRQLPGIYRVLRQESTKLNLGGFSYINFEEDLGVPGLRRVKESYGPAFMIEKYKVREK
ncbi:MAG: phosphatidylglycerol lysyltransferase domain-containing protein [Lachnospiraceae bacterium]|nr:phosphatidylglycerol lysyltransferase domain-containing protein [Lachnospiraceae bacterium]